MRLAYLSVLLIVATGVVAAQSQQDLESVRVRLGSLTYPRTAMDSQGGIVTLKAPAKRIVSLAGGTDEYLYQIVPPETMAGVSSSSYGEDFSAVLPFVTKYKPAVAKDAAGILALRPDLVVATDSAPPDVVRTLEDAGVPVFRLFTPVTKLDQVAANITVLGYVTGYDEGARKELARFQGEIAAIAEKCKTLHEPAKIFGVSMTGFGYGDQTLFHDVMRLVGGTNIAAENGMHTYQEVDKETVASWNPDWVFAWSVPGKQSEELGRWLEHPQFRETTAAKKQQIHVSQAKEVLPLSSLITTFARTIADATCRAQ